MISNLIKMIASKFDANTSKMNEYNDFKDKEKMSENYNSKHFIGHIVAKNGIKVATDNAIVSERIRNAVEDGSYEAAEVVVVGRVIRPNDVVLELGAGIGYISSIVMKSIGPSAYVAVEADPRLIPLIRQTHKLNEVSGVEVIQAIASSEELAIANGQLPFLLEDEFWGSRVDDDTSGAGVSVPIVSLNSLISSNRVTVIVADIEGYEKNVFSSADLSGVREIMVEVHRRQIGPAGMEALFAHMHREGLFLDGEKSYYNTLVFNRIE